MPRKSSITSATAGVTLCVLITAGIAGWGRTTQSSTSSPRATPAHPQAGTNPQARVNPVELGAVAWMRDVDDGFRQARRLNLPVLILFQEIPGCATCVGFGAGPLSFPLLVEAIESEFVPVAVYNNRGGDDALALARFGEPAWNNPVVRFFDTSRNELLPRRDGVWDTAGVTRRVIDALTAAGREVPAYLQLVGDELVASRARATFAMHCFWEGEATLGSVDGVVSTRTGWIDGREVVELEYLPDVLEYGDLVDYAVTAECAARVYAHDEIQLHIAERKVGTRASRAEGRARTASDSDQKRHLRRSEFRSLPLTPGQAARVNADLAAGREPERWLSPRQLELRDRIVALGARDRRDISELAPPTSITDLAEYESRLLARLDDARRN